MEISHAKGWLSKSVTILQILMRTLGEIEHIPRVTRRAEHLPRHEQAVSLEFPQTWEHLHCSLLS